MFDIGILDSPQIVEVQRSDLVSNFIGDTAKKPTEWVKKSFGKLLFVDEAYTLYSKSEKDFGKEAVETIMRYMLPSETSSEHHPIFVFCGYEGSMHEFLNLNKGLRRTIKQYFKFADHTVWKISLLIALERFQRRSDLNTMLPCAKIWSGKFATTKKIGCHLVHH